MLILYSQDITQAKGDPHDRQRKACCAGIVWRRCQFHVIQNALRYARKVSVRLEVTGGLRNVFIVLGRIKLHVATLFPNETSPLRLVCRILGEMSDDWVTGKTNLTTTTIASAIGIQIPNPG